VLTASVRSRSVSKWTSRRPLETAVSLMTTWPTLTDTTGELTRAVIAARRSNRSWSEIGAMLGVSKQAAQRKYGREIRVA